MTQIITFPIQQSWHQENNFLNTWNNKKSIEKLLFSRQMGLKLAKSKKRLDKLLKLTHRQVWLNRFKVVQLFNKTNLSLQVKSSLCWLAVHVEKTQKDNHDIKSKNMFGLNIFAWLLFILFLRKKFTVTDNRFCRHH